MTDRFARVLAMVAVALSAIAVVIAWYGVQQIQAAREDLRNLARSIGVVSTTTARALPLAPPPLEIERDSQ